MLEFLMVRHVSSVDCKSAAIGRSSKHYNVSDNEPNFICVNRQCPAPGREPFSSCYTVCEELKRCATLSRFRDQTLNYPPYPVY